MNSEDKKKKQDCIKNKNLITVFIFLVNANYPDKQPKIIIHTLQIKLWPPITLVHY